MTNPTPGIPAEAIEAAALVYERTTGVRDTLTTVNILEAAAPHMLAGLADSRDGDLFRFTWAQREWLRGGAL